MNKEKITELVLNCISELNEELEIEELKNANEDTKLYGGNSGIDSMSLVSLISDLEDRISEEFNQELVLANEKAMSQRVSPFRNISTLVSYIEDLLSSNN